MRTIYTDQKGVPYVHDREVLDVVYNGDHYHVVVHYDRVGSCIGCPMSTFIPCPLLRTGIFKQGGEFIYHTCKDLEEVVE